MRVMIVSANDEHKPDPVVPLGAALVAGAARDAGHEVRMFDACFVDDPYSELSSAIQSFEPDVVGLSIRNIDDVCWPRAKSYLPHYHQLTASIRAATPRPQLVLGGSAFTLMPDLFLSALEADSGVVGDGERAFVDLLARLDRGQPLPRIVRASETSPGTAPALDLLDLRTYYQRGGALNVQTRRGCAFQCSYCSYPLLEGRISRRRSATDVVDQLVHALELAGGRHFFVVDNTFNHPAQHAIDFCNELIRRRLELGWTAYVSPGGMHPALLDLMARAGCTSVEFGTDAAAAPTLAALGKSFGVDEIIDVSSRARAAGLKFAHSLILGGPDETLYTLRRTVEVMEQIRPDAVFGMLGVRLYAGTSLARRAEREGLIRESEIGLAPVFYVSEAVEPELFEYAQALSRRHANWYFPGVEGERWVRYWRRRRAHGVRGPLWEWMGNQEPVRQGGNR